MLTTILNNIPPPKFVVIQDKVSVPGKAIIQSIIKSHTDLKKNHIHFFSFESNPKQTSAKFSSGYFHIYDFLTDNNGWITDTNATNFIQFVENNKIKGVVVIDSLSLFILEYGLAATCRILHKLLSQQTIIQIVTILHTDTLLKESDTLKYIDHMTTLILKLNVVGKQHRVEYEYKKPGGKFIKKTEEYFFKDGVFLTKQLEHFDSTTSRANTSIDQLPEDMSTFKIGLNASEKKSRDKLVLPYTEKSNVVKSEQTGGSKIIYNLDEEDDWDDEDPDYDLDV